MKIRYNRIKQDGRVIEKSFSVDNGDEEPQGMLNIVLSAIFTALAYAIKAFFIMFLFRIATKTFPGLVSSGFAVETIDYFMAVIILCMFKFLKAKV